MPNLKTTAQAFKLFKSKKNIALFEKHGVLSERELMSRYIIRLENYCSGVKLEAKTMLNIVRKEILPSVTSYSKELSEIILAKNQIKEKTPCEYEAKILKILSDLSSELHNKTEKLTTFIINSEDQQELLEQANYCKDVVLPHMLDVRKIVDEMETHTPKAYWPYPSYEEILFKV